MTIPIWKEVRRKADAFAQHWRDASRESSESQSFYNDFFGIFGVLRRSVGHYEEQARKLDGKLGFIDLFWPGVLLVEQKSAGHDLDKALEQAEDYFDGIREEKRPRFILVSDFQKFELRDLDKRRRVIFRLEELPEHIKEFEFILEAAHGEGAWKSPEFAFPPEWEEEFETGLGSLEAVRPQLEAASKEVMNWPKTLPGGEEIVRPELLEMEARIEASTSSTTAVLGKPGSGKSAFMSRLTHRYIERGWAVLAVKADMLDADVSRESELQEHLALEAPPGDLLEQLAKNGPVLLVLDQVDALAGYIDLRTARLNILLNLVRRLGRVENVQIVISSRTFEFEHDSRLRAVQAESVTLELPPWSEVLKVLESCGVQAAGWPADAQEVMRSPQALAIYLTLKGRHASKPFTSYQSMLDRLWNERVLAHDEEGRRNRLATEIADRMADGESQRLATARFDDRARDIDGLEAAGILTRGDRTLGFTHQTLFDYALARSFARDPGRLSGYVLERQVSLFLRPKLWAALTYLREAEPDAYHRELEAIWHVPALRRHLRYLLIEFIGQQTDPTDREEVLMVGTLTLPGEKARTSGMLNGSPGWMKRLHRAFTALRAIWHTGALVRRLRDRRIECGGQEADPTGRGKARMAETRRLQGERVRAFRALSGSPGWFKRLHRTFIAEAMSEEGEIANEIAGVLERAWSFAFDDVERLLQERWTRRPEYDRATWWVLLNAPHWTEAMLTLACSIAQRTQIATFQIDYVVGTVGVEQPEAALRLARTRLDHELETAQAQSAELAKVKKPDFESDAEDGEWSEAAVTWASENDPKIPLEKLIEDRNNWDTLPTLAEQAPSSFLRILWPWFERCLDALAARSEDRNPGLQYALAYEADFRFEEEQGTGVVEPVLLCALRTAAERLAETEPEEWLAWAEKIGRIEVVPAQRLIAHSFTAAPEPLAGTALEFLLRDDRRYALGSSRGMYETSVRLVDAVNAHWSDPELKRFEAAVKAYNPAPPTHLTDAKGRRSWRRGVRKIKLSLLRTLPKHRLTAKARREIEQEERALPDVHLGTRVMGPDWIGSIMDAAAMARAADKDIINAFRTLPDKTGTRHPRRLMSGGNVQLAQEFAEFSKEHPERAVRVLKALDADTGTRAAGAALEAMSQEARPDQVLNLLHDVVARGFDNEDFRRSAARAIVNLVERQVQIDDETLAILEKWLAEPVTDEAAADETDGDAVTGTATESAGNDEEDEDPIHRSMLWGHGGISIMPSGDYPVLEAMIRILLARKETDRVYERLEAYLDRRKEPQAWDHMLCVLPQPTEDERPRRAAFLARLFAEVSGLVESKAATFTVVNSRRWSDEFADSQLNRWKDSDRASARQSYGEIVAKTALVDPSIQWAQSRQDELVANPALTEARAGAALTAAHLWPNPDVRPRAANLLLALLPEDDPNVWKAVAEIFRISTELAPDEPTIGLLEAIAKKPGRALREYSSFVATGLATVLPHEAELVARVAESLISDWREEIRDPRRTTAMAVQELVDLAVTLHRLGPKTREMGTKLFEELLEIDAQEARQTLDELDSRFREQGARRQTRLPRRRRRSRQAARITGTTC